MNPTDPGRRAEQPPAVAAGPDRSRPLVVVLLERPSPASWPLRQVTRLALRLRAELLVVAIVTYGRGLDELDQVNLRIAREGVQEVSARLVGQGVLAAGKVTLARHGEHAAVACDLADRFDPDLLVVLARHGAWFRVFPGSSLAHHLMRRQHRPVVVIPDREARLGLRGVVRYLVGADAARGD